MNDGNKGNEASFNIYSHFFHVHKYSWWLPHLVLSIHGLLVLCQLSANLKVSVYSFTFLSSMQSEIRNYIRIMKYYVQYKVLNMTWMRKPI